MTGDIAMTTALADGTVRELHLTTAQVLDLNAGTINAAAGFIEDTSATTTPRFLRSATSGHPATARGMFAGFRNQAAPGSHSERDLHDLSRSVADAR